jgi:hypothetical protein
VAKLPCMCSLARVQVNSAGTGRSRFGNCTVLCESCRSESVKCCDRELCQSHEGVTDSERRFNFIDVGAYGK